MTAKASHKRLGFITTKPLHSNDTIFCRDLPIGYITSSNISYNLTKFISMGYVKVDFINEKLYCKSRDREINLDVSPLPFVKHNFYRK